MNGNILIVEDEAIIADFVQDLLTKNGFCTVGVADTLASAVESARTVKPELILMDIRLKDGSSGIDAANVIHSNWNIPIVFMTAHSDSSTLNRAMGVHPYGYLVKPVREADLIATVRTALSRYRWEHQSRSSSDDYRELFRDSTELIFSVTPSGILEYVNPSWLRTLGFTKEKMEAFPLLTLVPSREREAFNETLSRVLAGETPDRVDTVFLTASGEEVYAEGSLRCRYEAGQAVAIRGIFRDITEHRRTAERLLKEKLEAEEARDALREFATRDALTGIWNRRMILEILLKELSRAEREEVVVVIFLFDIDHFKRVNDHHGHLVGDSVLQEVARRVAGSVRPYDSVGRYGGEEFLVIMPVPGRREPDMVAMGERVRAAVNHAPIKVDSHSLKITVSVGGARFISGDTGGIDELIERADKAMLLAKKGGRNRLEIAPEVPRSAILTPEDRRSAERRRSQPKIDNGNSSG